MRPCKTSARGPKDGNFFAGMEYEQPQGFQECVHIVGLLKVCARQKDLQRGAKIHAHVLKRHLLEKNSYVASTLVNMYAKCGSLQRAAQVLAELPDRDVVTWTALITGYAQHGQGQEAIQCFEQMKREAVPPNTITYISVLNACGSIQAVNQGEQIHDEITKLDLLRSNVALGNSLVDMYAKCGVLAKAAEMFDKLPLRDVVSWNSLIAGYVHQAQGEEALKCFEWMQTEGLTPDAVTFICILKACGSIKAAEKGEQIHKEIERQGLLEKDIVLGNALVDMYVKCCAVTKASKVFYDLPVWNVVGWSALISGYVQQGQGEEALICFEKMQREGLSPDVVTYSCILKACGSIGALDRGEQVYKDVVRQGLLRKDAELGSAVVDMYANCSALAKAAKVLQELPVRNAITWSALIAGYVQEGKGEDAWNCFERMQQEGLSPDMVTLICILKACGNIRALDKGVQVHQEIVRQRMLGKDLLLDNTLVDMYCKCGALAKAAQVVHELPVLNEVTWSILIAGYVQYDQGEEALECFDWMQVEGLFPDRVTFICILKACASLRAVDRGHQIHREIAKHGLLRKDITVAASLMDMYAKCGALEKALLVLEEIPVRNVITWTALIAGYVQVEQTDEALQCFKKLEMEGICPNEVTFICILKACGNIGAIEKGKQIHKEIVRQGWLAKNLMLATALVDMYSGCGELAEAVRVLDQLPIRDAVSWGTIIMGYVNQGQGEEAMKCFHRMQGEGLSPDPVTFACILKACCSTGAVDKGEQIHYEIVRQGLLEKDFVLGTVLLNMYAKCGALAKAVTVFNSLLIQNIVTWTALIAGFAYLGQAKEALKCLKQMQYEGLLPNAITLINMFSAYSRSGLLEEGQTSFADMNSEFGISPDTEHHTSMVDLLCRAGEFDMALAVIDQMPCCDHLPVWHALLSACRGCGNVMYGQVAFDNAVKVDRKDAAAYVLMNDIYAFAGIEGNAHKLKN